MELSTTETTRVNEENGGTKNDPDDHTTATEVEDITSDVNSRKFLYLSVCIANLAALTAGITIGWTSPEIPKLMDNSTTPLSTPITMAEESWVGSLLPLGAAIGPFIAGMLAGTIGRKKTLLLITIPFIAAFIGAAHAQTIWLFYIIRFAWGISVGSVFTVVPMYVGEISDDAVRGALGSLLQLFVTSGLLLSYSVGPYINIALFNYICLLPAILFMVFFLIFIPESPYFLLEKNCDDEAEKALSKFRSSSNVKIELDCMKQIVEEAKANKGSFIDLFKTRVYLKALLLCAGLMICQQFSGITIVLFYTYDVTGNSMPFEIATIMVGVMQVVFSLISPILVERRGKRFLLLSSAIGMTISLSGLGYYFYLKDVGSSTDAIFWLPILCLVIYNAAYCGGFGSLPWAIMGELFPANVKSAASTLSAATSWSCAFLVTGYFSLVASVIGKGFSFLIFAACCVIAGLFVYKFVPETSGKSLQEIQDILEGKETKKENQTN